MNIAGTEHSVMYKFSTKKGILNYGIYIQYINITYILSLQHTSLYTHTYTIYYVNKYI